MRYFSVLMGLLVCLFVSAQAQAADPVGYWNLDEGTGTTAYDSSSNDNHCGLVGGTWTTGKVGSAFGFHNKRDYARCSAQNGTLRLANEITIEAWVYPFADNTCGTIVRKGIKYVRAKTNYALQVDGGVLTFRYRDTGGSYHVWRNLALKNVPNETWTHIAITYTFGTGSSIKAYVNGEEFSGGWAYGDGNNAPWSEASPFYMGQEYYLYGYNFNGIIDEVAIFKTALSANEIKLHYEHGVVLGSALAGDVDASVVNLLIDMSIDGDAETVIADDVDDLIDAAIDSDAATVIADDVDDLIDLAIGVDGEGVSDIDRNSDAIDAIIRALNQPGASGISGKK